MHPVGEGESRLMEKCPYLRQTDIQIPVVAHPDTHVKSSDLLQRRSSYQGLAGGKNEVSPEKTLPHIAGRARIELPGLRDAQTALLTVHQHRLGITSHGCNLPFELVARPYIIVIEKRDEFSFGFGQSTITSGGLTGVGLLEVADPSRFCEGARTTAVSSGEPSFTTITS